MIYNSNNFAIHKITGTDSKPEISGVHITPQGTVATDSMALIFVSCPQDNPKDFPEKPNQPVKARQIDAIIPKNTAQKLEKELKSIKGDLPILKNTIISNFKDEKQVMFETTDLETWNTMTSKVIEGKFPDWRKLVPDKKVRAEFEVNADYLINLLSVLKNTTGNNKKITIKIYEKADPIFFEAKGSGQESLGLLMPLKTN